MKKLNVFTVVASTFAVTAMPAFAALPTEVTEALETAKTDGVAMAGIVLAVIIAIAAFKFIRRAL